MFLLFLIILSGELRVLLPLHLSYSDVISSRGRAAKITILLILKSVSKNREVHVQWGNLALKVDLGIMKR